MLHVKELLSQWQREAVGGFTWSGLRSSRVTAAVL